MVIDFTREWPKESPIAELENVVRRGPVFGDVLISYVVWTGLSAK